MVDQRNEHDDATQCEGCGTAIFEGDQCSGDSEASIWFCEKCAPTWQDVLSGPESFYEWDGDRQVFYTAVTAKAAADAHVSTGGALTDKFGLHPY